MLLTYCTVLYALSVWHRVTLQQTMLLPVQWSARGWCPSLHCNCWSAIFLGKLEPACFAKNTCLITLWLSSPCTVCIRSAFGTKTNQWHCNQKVFFCWTCMWNLFVGKRHTGIRSPKLIAMLSYSLHLLLFLSPILLDLEWQLWRPAPVNLILT